MRQLTISLLGLVLLAGCAVAPGAFRPGAATQPVDAPQPIAAPITADQPLAAENLRGLLARQLQVDLVAVTVVSTEAVAWPDGCLGAAGAEEVCAQVVTPGYKITLSVDGQEYSYHSDNQGYWARLVAGPDAAVGRPIITWQGTVDNGSCMQATIGAGGVAFGGCGGTMLGGKFVAPQRAALLAELAARYRSFSAVTDAGQIEFTGQGSAAATPAEELRIAAWSQKVTMEAAAGAAFGGIGWFGPTQPGNPADTTKCASLQAGSGGEAVLGSCDGLAQTVALDARMAEELTYLVDLLAPFNYETATETVLFDGMGGVESEAWQRAVAAWGRTRYAELRSGKVSAAGATVMSWDLGPVPLTEDVCRRLTVLGWGYAQAEMRTCDGAHVIDVTSSWLGTHDLERIDPWLYARAPYHDGSSYIAGLGVEPMSERDVADAQAWAAEFFGRTGPQTGATSVPAQPAGCPVAQADAMLLVDELNGYCLLYPAGYVAEQTSPSEVTLVLGSLMNHTDPRVAIAVEDTAGRTLEQVAEQWLADYVPPGFAVAQDMTTVDGVDAFVLDNLPGQDLNRRVAIIHDGRLYSFFFTPLGESGAANAALETFYASILDSFHFLAASVP